MNNNFNYEDAYMISKNYKNFLDSLGDPPVLIIF